MEKPEHQLLSRLSEEPALVTRGSDAVDCEGEVVFIDQRDVREVKEMDLTGKIILTPESSAWFAEAFEKGALGLVSYSNYISPLHDPDQVMFDMSLSKGKTKNKVFSFQISQRLGYQLRDMVLQGQKVVLHAKTKTAEFPFKLDTVFAAVKGTNPEKKGLMFTAHLFERPERSLDFLWIEGGAGTMAFFRKYPEMEGRLFGAINMDMVGENLDENHAFFNIENPYYSKSTFLTSAVKDFADFTFVANLPTSDFQAPTAWMPLPFPMVENNGSLQAFRYRMTPYRGGSDHGLFLESDAGIPALSFNVWPDLSYHTDKDLPEKSDPTQLKRVAFIAAASSLAMCSGKDDVLEGLIRETQADRLVFIQEAMARSASSLERLKTGDKGVTFKNALNNISEAVRISQEALGGIKELVRDKPKAAKSLDLVNSSFGKLGISLVDNLRGIYTGTAGVYGYQAEFAKPTVDEQKLEKIIPRKIKPIRMADRFPYTDLLSGLRKNPALQKSVFLKYSFNGLVEMLIAVDGKKSLGQIRNLLSFEFTPVDAADMLDMAKSLEEAKLIETTQK